MSYEFKKIFNELYVKLLVCGILIGSLAVAIITINSFGELESPDSVKELKGKAAIELSKSRYKNIRGELTLVKINEALRYYKSIPSPDEASAKTDERYPGVPFLLDSAYSKTMGTANLHNLKSGNDFYKRNVVQIENKIAKAPDEYGDREKETIIQRASAIKTPYYFDFHGQWKRGYTSLTMLFIVISIASILVGSRLFSYERENNMEIILTTLGKSKLYAIARKKVFALWAFITILCFLSVTIFSICYFAIAGLSAWNSQIQIGYFMSVNQLTFGEAYIAMAIVGWISLLAIGTLVALFNAYIQRSLASLAIGLVIVILPWILVKLGVFPTIIKKFFSLQPFNGLFAENNLLSLHVYKFAFFDVLTMTAVLINSLCILAFCYLISPRLFGQRIIKN